uniref:Histone acetyltransferase n=1 Tax=Lygus hesperus TaxID=30085 RepID=A0A0A9WMK8_LYGHE
MPRPPKEIVPAEPNISVGKYYFVKREEELLKSKILDIRIGENNSKEYYVHYESLNRRLDEWVQADRIVTRGVPGDEDLSTFSQNLIGGQRNRIDEEDLVDSESPTDDLEREHKQLTKVKHIDCIQFGMYEIDTWYFSPYPDEYGKQKKLFICEYCLKYMKLEKTYRYHLGECIRRHPPGKEIYHKGTLSIFETDGTQSRLYCQNLCLLAKLFIDHKTIFFDIEQFLFYILCEVDKHGSHLVGYFSKEKGSPDGNNVACIVTLPPFQRQGYGKLLIAFSYELSKIEGVLGSPEHPLSDLGKLSYRSYWSWVLLDILRELKGNVTVRKLSEMTSITCSDIISTLESMSMLKYRIGNDAACVTPHLVDECIRSAQFKRPRLTVDTAHLKWDPPSTGKTEDSSSILEIDSDEDEDSPMKSADERNDMETDDSNSSF